MFEKATTNRKGLLRISDTNASQNKTRTQPNQTKRNTPNRSTQRDTVHTMMKQELLLRRLFTGAFSVLLVVSHFTRPALACPCSGPITIQSSLANSETAVFSTIFEKLSPPTVPSAAQYYRADAEGVLKGCGLIRDTFYYIKTAASSAQQCGVDLQVNVRYILFGTVTYEPIAGFGSAIQPVLTIDSCKAQSVLSNVDRPTQTYLYNQPNPICNRPPPVPVPVPVPVPAPIRPPSAQSVNCQVCPTGFYDGCNTCGCREGFTTFCSTQTCTTYRTATCTNGIVGPVPVPRPIPVPVPMPVPVPVPRPVVVPAPVPTRIASTNIFTCQTCPSGYYDGCNTCSCDPSGRATCSAFTCPTYNGPPSCRLPWPMPLPPPLPSPVAVVARPSRVASGSLSTPAPTAPVYVWRPATVSCASCRTSSFYDGCNTCNCLSDGYRTCTRRVCSNYGTAYCGNLVRPVTTPVPPPQPMTNPMTNPMPLPTASASIIDVNCRNCPHGYADGCNTCGCSNTGTAFCSKRDCPTHGAWRCV
jgi:hypothetical protein